MPLASTSGESIWNSHRSMQMRMTVKCFKKNIQNSKHLFLKEGTKSTLLPFSQEPKATHNSEHRPAVSGVWSNNAVQTHFWNCPETLLHHLVIWVAQMWSVDTEGSLNGRSIIALVLWKGKEIKKSFKNFLWSFEMSFWKMAQDTSWKTEKKKWPDE